MRIRNKKEAITGTAEKRLAVDGQKDSQMQRTYITDYKVNLTKPYGYK